MTVPARVVAIDRMKCRSAAIWILLALSAQTAAPARTQSGPGLGPSRTDFIATYLNAAETTPWPGYRPDAEPFLIEFEGEDGGSSVMVAARTAPDGFTPVPGLDAPKRRVLQRPGASRTPDRSMKAVPGAPYPRDFKRYRIGAGKESDPALSVMLHELFHIHQESAFSETVATDAIPYEDAESLASLYAEHLLLSRALNDDDRWREAAKDFVVLRDARRRRRPQTVAPEDYQERYEGTARYVELCSAVRGLGEAAWISRTAADLMSSLRDNHRSHRSRYYSSGAAIGMLLDRTGIDWKRRVAAGSPLFTLLSAEMTMSASESAERLKRVRGLYSLPSLQAEAATLLTEESVQRKKSLEEFERLGRWTLALSAPPGTEITDHVGVDLPLANFDDGTELAKVDFFAVRVGNNLELDLHQTAIMESLHVYDRSTKRWSPTIKFPLDASVDIILDGNRWSPNVDQRRFRTVTIKDEHSSLVIRSPGRLSVRGRELLVEWGGR